MGVALLIIVSVLLIINLKHKFTMDEDEKRFFEGMRKQEEKGWVFKVGPRGGMSKYYDASKDQSPNKDGWDIFKDFRETHKLNSQKLVNKLESKTNVRSKKRK